MIFKKAIGKILDGLAKTREVFSRRITDLFAITRKVDPEFLDKLEELLISADIGVEATGEIIGDIKTAYKQGVVKDTSGLLDHLKAALKSRMSASSPEPISFPQQGPCVILVVGVNGTGKTTSIAKLAGYLQSKNKKVMLAASDTFRAAAIEQLTIWSQRLGVQIIAHKDGADPAAVAYDAAEAAVARKADVLIVDTAGRLHTKANLMKELAKINGVLAKKIPGAPHEVLLVLDATTGQNAIAQAKVFKESSPITGVFLAKLDGTAKGGIVVAIRKQLDIPVKFVGVGEKLDDIEVFDPEKFVDALFEA